MSLSLTPLPGPAKAAADDPSEPVDLAGFDHCYRIVCQHLALARQRLYGADIEEYLNQLALRAHRHLYEKRVGGGRALFLFLREGFPRAVRRLSSSLVLSTILFTVPAAGIAIAIAVSPSAVSTVMEPEQIREVEQMYDPKSDRFLKEREAGTNFEMFGFYIANNIGIAFRTFAGGVFLGIGTVLVLISNGILIAAVGAHLVSIGSGSTFFPFVCGHSAFELTAIVLAGASGLHIGRAILAPGRKRRARALAEAARECVPVLYGMTGMLLIAAFLEAYWSSSVLISAGLKYFVASLLWSAVLLYFAFAGRVRES